MTRFRRSHCSWSMYMVNAIIRLMLSAYPKVIPLSGFNAIPFHCSDLDSWSVWIFGFVESWWSRTIRFHSGLTFVQARTDLGGRIRTILSRTWCRPRRSNWTTRSVFPSLLGFIFILRFLLKSLFFRNKVIYLKLTFKMITSWNLKLSLLTWNATESTKRIIIFNYCFHVLIFLAHWWDHC